MTFEEQTTTDAQAGFSLLEAMISVALIAIAMMGAFSVSKVMLQSKELVDRKTDFQLASQTLNNHIVYELQTLNLSEVVSIPAGQVVYNMGSSCPFSSSPLRTLLMKGLCQIRFIKHSSATGAAPNYRVQITTAVEDAVTNKYLRIGVSFFNVNTGRTEFERVFLHVK